MRCDSRACNSSGSRLRAERALRYCKPLRRPPPRSAPARFPSGEDPAGTLLQRVPKLAIWGVRRTRPRAATYRREPVLHFRPETSLMKFRPLHDRVVIKRVEEVAKSKGGIIIPDTAKEKPQEGEVIAVGPGARDESGKLIPIDLKAGDLVLFGKWSGSEVKIDGQDLLIMKESDIMGVLEREVAAKKAA